MQCAYLGAVDWRDPERYQSWKVVRRANETNKGGRIMNVGASGCKWVLAVLVPHASFSCLQPSVCRQTNRRRGVHVRVWTQQIAASRMYRCQKLLNWTSCNRGLPQTWASLPAQRGTHRTPDPGNSTTATSPAPFAKSCWGGPAQRGRPFGPARCSACTSAPRYMGGGTRIAAFGQPIGVPSSELTRRARRTQDRLILHQVDVVCRVWRPVAAYSGASEACFGVDMQLWRRRRAL